MNHIKNDTSNLSFLIEHYFYWNVGMSFRIFVHIEVFRFIARFLRYQKFFINCIHTILEKIPIQLIPQHTQFLFLI